MTLNLLLIAVLLTPATPGTASDNCDSPLALGPRSSAYEEPYTRKAAQAFDARGHEYYINRFGKRVPEPPIELHFMDPPPDATLFRCERPRFSGRLGYCDKSGEIKIPAQFSDVDNFHEHLAVVATFDTKEWGFIDETGAWKIPPLPKYQFFHEFHDGLAAVDLCGKCAYLNHDGVQPFPATFFQCFNFAEGIGKVRPKQDETAFIDTSGKVIAALRGNWVEDAYLSGGLVPSQQGELIGFVDKKGEWVIPARFESIRPFVEGLAAVKEKGRWGYIDSCWVIWLLQPKM